MKADELKQAELQHKADERKQKLPVKEVHEPETAKSPELTTAEEDPKTAESSQQTLSKMNPMIQIKTELLFNEDYTGEQIAILEPGDTFPLERSLYV